MSLVAETEKLNNFLTSYSLNSDLVKGIYGSFISPHGSINLTMMSID